MRQQSDTTASPSSGSTSSATTASTRHWSSSGVSSGQSPRPRRQHCQRRSSPWSSKSSSIRAGRAEAAAWERRRASTGSVMEAAGAGRRRPALAGPAGCAWAAEGAWEGAGEGRKGGASARGRLPAGDPGEWAREPGEGAVPAAWPKHPGAFGPLESPGEAAGWVAGTRAWPPEALGAATRPNWPRRAAESARTASSAFTRRSAFKRATSFFLLSLALPGSPASRHMRSKATLSAPRTAGIRRST